ncbi:hypothetical protein ACF0H5_006845 [Mactra antiquata]
MYWPEYSWSQGWHRPSTPTLRRNNNGGKRSRSLSFHQTTRRYKMFEGVDHSGYIDIKQPAKIKGRKLKSWKKKWVVVHEMSIRSAGRSAAKVDIYTSEKVATDSPADKLTFIVEFVSDIRQAKSKTHQHAFEVVEKEPVLLFAGRSELESQTWMSVFRNIFFRDQDTEDNFPVCILHNEHTDRLSLQGDYTMTINPEVIAISSDTQNSYEWSLHTLRRFYLDKDQLSSDKKILTIECGPKSECGEAKFQFRGKNVTDILAAIKKNIFIALTKRQADVSIVTSGKTTSDTPHERTLSAVSKDKRFKELLETSSESIDKDNSGDITDDDRILDDVSNASSTEISKKKRHSVTFEKSVIEESKESTDLLSTPIESKPDDENEDEYNVLGEEKTESEKTASNIVSVITVAKPGYQTKVLLDENGYSHVEFKNSKPVISDDKSRSLSNMSSRSSVSCRSESIGSRDSGILYSKSDKSKANDRPPSKRSTNSFDSAMSTSSTTVGQSGVIDVVGDNKQTLTVEIHEIEMTGEELMNNGDTTIQTVNNKNDDDVYQDVAIEEAKVNETTEQNKQDPLKAKLKKSSSAGDCKENEYEDLDNFRKGKKNLIKHLGMDPQIDPNSVPPALPERPSSYKMKRKFGNNDKKLFTLPFARNKSKKNKERRVSISSSSGDSDSVKENGKQKADISLKAWPLGNKSVIVGNEDLYQPIAIERFLQDNDGMSLPQKRERSSSLNLNNVSAMKRPSISSDRIPASTIERRNVLLKHNRNVSMQMDILSRKPDLFEDEVVDARDRFNMTVQPMLNVTSRGNSVDDMNTTNDTSKEHFEDDEPIYAEVETPTALKSDIRVENPFPELDSSIWTPNIGDVSDDLNGTKYENDDSMSSLNRVESKTDDLNQGFCDDDNLGDTSKCDNVLVDLSTSDVTSSQTSIKAAVDIFNMGVGPMFVASPPLKPLNTNTSTMNCSVKFIDLFDTADIVTANEPVLNVNTSDANETGLNVDNECIYMDMTSCKNESIYVMPSTLKK